MIVDIVLNHENKGSFFVNGTDDGDFFVKVADLKGMGISDPSGDIRGISGEPHISLRSMRGVEYAFDERRLSLNITSSPELFEKNTVDFLPKRQENVYYPQDSSAFLNYGIDYFGDDTADSGILNITNELGVRRRDVLFLTGTSYTDTAADERFTRLMSSLIYDRRRDMQRVVAGDFIASSGYLGSHVNLGGLSFSKLYLIDPYFIEHPMLGISGHVELPSNADIYLDGNMIKTVKLPPGEFDLKNIFYYGGARDVEVVIKDVFGRERRLKYPYYFSDILLKKGLQEYSYNAGFGRERYGIKSNEYGDFLFLGFHKYGVSDSLTLGLRTEGKKDLYNLGPQASYGMGNAGIITVSAAGSLDDNRAGFAGSMDYIYRKRNMSARLHFTGYSEDYATLGRNASEKNVQYETGANASYYTKGLGALSLDISAVDGFRGRNRDRISFTYSKTLTRRASIFTTVSAVQEGDTAYEFFVGVNYYPWRDYAFLARYRHGEDVNTESLLAQKTIPFGEGYGFRTLLERSEIQGETAYTFSPSVQYNARYGIYRGEYWMRSINDETRNAYQVSASGAIAHIGDTVGLTRPVRDSFGLVRVGDLEGVDVYRNNQEMGKTDSAGKVFIPELYSYYENEITINDGAVPIDFSIEGVRQVVSPPYRSGTCIFFDINKLQAFTGKLKIKLDTELKPVEFSEITMVIDGKTVTFPTGKGGELYFENRMAEGRRSPSLNGGRGCSSLNGITEGARDIRPGEYKAAFHYDGEDRSCDITIPESNEMIIDLGEIVCAMPPSRIRTEPVAPESVDTRPVEPVPEETATTVNESKANGPDGENPIDLPDETAKECERVNITSSSDAGNVARRTFIVHFSSDSDVPFIEDETVIKKVSCVLLYNAAFNVEIAGHCDRSGSGEYNLKLGMKRAVSVKNRLLEMGIQETRITGVVSYGKKKLLCKSPDEECKKKNRRAVMRLSPDNGEKNPDGG